MFDYPAPLTRDRWQTAFLLSVRQPDLKNKGQQKWQEESEVREEKGEIM